MAKAKTKIDFLETDKMQWPEGWERTRIQDRKPQSSWKKPWNIYRDLLVKELERMGATSVLICRSRDERLDPGVAVWFSRAKEDFSWQEGLGLDTPAPTIQQIDDAFRTKAMRYHPDRPDGDPEMFRRYSEMRKAATAWVRGTHQERHEFVIPCDRFNEARLNLAALRLAFTAFRSLERIGAPAILERTMQRAFRAALPAEASTEVK